MGSKRRREQPAESDAQASTGAHTETQTEAVASNQNTESQHGNGNDEPVHPSKKPRVEKSRTLFVRSLPPTTTAETLTEFFSQHFPVKHATVILDPKTKTSRGYGFVTFTDAEDAKDAKEKLQKEKIEGRPLILDLAEPRHRQGGAAAAEAVEKKQERRDAIAEARKAPKLIVRNLPWSIKTSAQLEALFRSYGKVKYADLPQNKGKLSGFGFVTMRGHKNAERAMEMVNGKLVDGRTLAVDWAVDKKQWEEQQTKGGGQAANADDASSQEGDEGEEKDGDKDEDDEDDDEDMDDDLKNFMKNHMQNLEEEDSDAEDPEGEGEDEDDDEAEPKEFSAPKTASTTTDNRTTIFIRNLPFTTTDEQLKAHFEQFGRVRYARVVVDRATDRPAGTGFVCFVSEDDSKACLRGAPRPQPAPSAGAEAPKKHQSILQDEAADPEGRYTIEGRILQVSQAVSRDEATRLAETGAAARAGKSDRDKRRLYLLSEGTVPSGSALHSVLTPAELQMREQSAAQRKRLIQGNPSLHLSLTRLAVRNIPREIGSKELKALAREAVVGFARDAKAGVREGLSAEEKARGGEVDREAEKRRREKGRGVVTQAKVVFENRQGGKVAEAAETGGRSRGYGFIEYTSHRWALMGLRWLNGHALRCGATGKTQRLIVEFAIENAQVVQRRRELQARSRAGALRKDAHDAGEHEDAFEEESKGKDKGKSKGKGKGGAPRGKDFSVSSSKDKRQQPKAKNGKAGDGDDEEKNGASARDALQQKIIARKRMTRKKKAQTRRS